MFGGYGSEFFFQTCLLSFPNCSLCFFIQSLGSMAHCIQGNCFEFRAIFPCKGYGIYVHILGCSTCSKVAKGRASESKLYKPCYHNSSDLHLRLPFPPVSRYHPTPLRMKLYQQYYHTFLHHGRHFLITTACMSALPWHDL